MENEKINDAYEKMPFTAIIHTIATNKIRYFKKIGFDINMKSHGRYLIHIHENNLSQEDLAELFGQTKGTVAKSLKYLETEGYIERKADPTNRRKYILTVTEKGEEAIPVIKNNLEEWEEKVGISDLDDETREKIREIARKSKLLLED